MPIKYSVLKLTSKNQTITQEDTTSESSVIHLVRSWLTLSIELINLWSLRQQKLLRLLKESGDLDGLVEMMGKEDNEEDSQPFETKSLGQWSQAEMDLARSTGLSPEQASAILDEA